MTSSPSETEQSVSGADAEEAVEETPAPDPLAEWAAEVADAVGGTATATFGTAKVSVDRDSWVEAITTARDQFGLVFFSWLSAVDWSNDVAVGDPLNDETTERYEVLCTIGDLSEGRRVTFSTDLSKDDASLPSLIEVFAGADWHEREAHDMFGISFRGHPNLVPIYLPDGFQGHPLRKDYPLLSREVKPWPGKVDVEAMPEDDDEDTDPTAPSTENPEA